MVARSGNAAQTSSSDEDACTAQGTEAPCVSTTTEPTSGVYNRGGDDMGIGDMAYWQLSAMGGAPADTTLPHVALATCGIPSAVGGVHAHATHAVPAACGLPSAAGGPPAAILLTTHAIPAARGAPSAVGGPPTAT